MWTLPSGHPGRSTQGPQTPVEIDAVDDELEDAVGTHKVYRDAGTGEFVTAEFAAENPDTTVSESVPDAEVDTPDNEE